MSPSYYNEPDPYAAEQLRSLIRRGLIPPGDVDTRSIEDICPDELRGFTQCHFFAGIGVWPLALRNAGWPDDRPVWTGSCPCTPFSTAGSRKGFADERHFWPAFHWLIQQCRPAVVFGEQVASQPAWIDLVHADLEAVGYAVGCVAFPAASVGAPHIRERAYWVAHADRDRREPRGQAAEATRYGHPADPAGGDGTAGPVDSCWSVVDWLRCQDGKWRPTEPGIFPLVDGASCRMAPAMIRAYGNALVEPAARAFIQTAASVISDHELPGLQQVTP